MSLARKRGAGLSLVWPTASPDKYRSYSMVAPVGTTSDGLSSVRRASTNSTPGAKTSHARKQYLFIKRF